MGIILKSGKVPHVFFFCQQNHLPNTKVQNSQIGTRNKQRQYNSQKLIKGQQLKLKNKYSNK